MSLLAGRGAGRALEGGRAGGHDGTPRLGAGRSQVKRQKVAGGTSRGTVSSLPLRLRPRGGAEVEEAAVAEAAANTRPPAAAYR